MYVVLSFGIPNYLLNEGDLCVYSFMLHKLRRSMYVGIVFCSIHAFLSLTHLFLCGKWQLKKSSLEYLFLSLTWHSYCLDVFTSFKCVNLYYGIGCSVVFFISCIFIFLDPWWGLHCASFKSAHNWAYNCYFNLMFHLSYASLVC
jgi:hypothetical protein